MKTKLIAFLALITLGLGSCTETESDEFCNDPNAQCPDTSNIEASSCCTDQECYWVYNGIHYNCDGDDCTDAINTIIASACASGSADIDISIQDFDLLRSQMQEATQKLLIEARQASGCGDSY